MKNWKSKELNPQSLRNFFNSKLLNAQTADIEVASRVWSGNLITEALEYFHIEGEKDLGALDHALEPLAYEDFGRSSSTEGSVDYYDYLVFVTTLRRFVRNRMATKVSEDDGRFDRVVSPPLAAYEYHGNDKIKGVFEGETSYRFLER